jgi:hypothetical protein
MILKFISDAEYNDTVKYKAGQIVDFSDDGAFAYRWIRRGLAVEVAGKVESPVEEVKKTVEAKETLTVAPPVNKRSSKTKSEDAPL